jgi:hypothetical protein
MVFSLVYLGTVLLVGIPTLEEKEIVLRKTSALLARI